VEPQKVGRRMVNVARLSFLNPVESVQAFQTFADLSCGHLRDRSTIICGNLAMNLTDLAAPQLAVRFENTQEVTGFHGNMLTNVAHE